MITHEVLVNRSCALSENPFWDTDAQRFLWTDITGGAIWSHDASTDTTTKIYDGPNVGGFTQEADGSLLLFRTSDVVKMAADGSFNEVAQFSEEGDSRFNDVIADPRGRVFAGTVGNEPTSGGVYRYDPDGSVRRVITGTGCSNGMAFTANRTKFYWTCSTRKQIYVYDYDEASGDISNGRLWYQADEEEGITDGLTIDLDDNIWSARWDGYRVRKHDAQDGHVLDEIKFPVAKVSSVVFGGVDFDTMYLTTAGGDGEESLDGAIFTLQVPSVKGRPEFRSRLTG
ncbi:MAG: gluconolaconase [Opitutaceae bacterium]|jgi:D-xylono/L-arabinono-1,4-lactonase|nr:gluconolaconase [Opitutaceae bacterium]|tara:strand:- start:1810 stop:2664 length:855 start_codon:yes stop_codon:yes gene_type:complete